MPVDGAARAGAALVPDAGNAALLSHPGLVPAPELDFGVEADHPVPERLLVHARAAFGRLLAHLIQDVRQRDQSCGHPPVPSAPHQAPQPPCLSGTPPRPARAPHQFGARRSTTSRSALHTKAAAVPAPSLGQALEAASGRESVPQGSVVASEPSSPPQLFRRRVAADPFASASLRPC